MNEGHDFLIEVNPIEIPKISSSSSSSSNRSSSSSSSSRSSSCNV